MSENLYIQHFNEESRPLAYYLAKMDGYTALKKAFGMSQDDIINEVKKSNLRKGDLVFFYSGISHVGIYAGKGKIIHASRPGRPVAYIKIKYMPYAGARRPH